jgi:hypothetical protein
MTSWWRVITAGFACWLILFAVAVLAAPFRQSMRPLFESIMGVAVTATAVVLGLMCIRRMDRPTARQAFGLGFVWFAICIVVDAPLMLFGGPMTMSFVEYMADIGLTYVSIPVVTLGLGLATTKQSAATIDPKR